MAKAGRPTKYTKKLADEIIEKMESGKTLSEICRDEKMPHRGTVIRWSQSDRCGFRDRYEKAQDIRALTMVDEIIDIADNSNGETARDRLRVDARKWIVSKLIPKYSDKGDGPTDIAAVIAEALIRRSESLPQ